MDCKRCVAAVGAVVMTLAIAVSSRRAAGAASGSVCAGRTAALAVGGQAAVADGATALAGDHIVTALSGDGSISAKAIVTTNLVAEASRCQGLERQHLSAHSTRQGTAVR